MPPSSTDDSTRSQDWPAIQAALEVELMLDAADGQLGPLERYLERYEGFEAVVRQCYAEHVDFDAGGHSNGDPSTTIETFRSRYRSDREAGEVQPLASYLERFPGHDLAIARLYAVLDSDRSTGPGVAEHPLNLDSLGEVEAGQSLGPYRLERHLGQGGQGAVFEAFDTRLQRHVAVKVLVGRRLNDPISRGRFEREARLASAVHDPGICPVYDSGFDHGRAYLVMRLIEGETLAARIRSAREKRCSLFERSPSTSRSGSTSTGVESVGRGGFDRIASFFERTSRSLHTAHLAGVVHRDIKPGNIMVQPDGTGVILDFGLARDEGPDSLALSRTGDVLGTPAYMAPEQIAGESRLGARTDVYALGVCLYEALTLRRPFEAPTPEALYHAILHGDPIDPRRLNPGLPRDLAIIVSTAIEKEPNRRYANAEELAEDLRRFREFEPIRARPPGMWLRLWRWRQRHPALAAAVLLFILGVAGIGYLQSRSMAEIATARDEAVKINEFLVRKLLLAVTPRESRGREITVAEVFEDAAENVTESFPEPSRVGASLRFVLGEAHGLMGNFEEAHRWYSEAHEIRLEVLGPDHRDTLNAALRSGATLMELDRLEEADSLLNHVRTRGEEVLGPDDTVLLGADKSLAELAVRRGRYAEARPIQERNYQANLRVHGPTERSTLNARHALARTLDLMGEEEAAEPEMRAVLELRRQVFGEDDSDVSRSLSDLGSLLHDLERWDEAALCYEEAVAAAERVFGTLSWDYACTINNMASLYNDRGLRTGDAESLALAEELYLESLEVRREVFPERHTHIANALSNLGMYISQRGRTEEAQPYLDEALAIRTELYGEYHPLVFVTLCNLASNHLVAGRTEDAVAGYRRAVESGERIYPEGSADLSEAHFGLGFCLRRVDRLDEAAEAMRVGYEMRAEASGADSARARRMAHLLGSTHEERGNEDEAARWRERAESL